MPSDTNARSAQTAGSTLLDAQGQVIHQSADQAQAAGDQLVGAIRRQPITAALIIFAVGYIFGKIT